MEAICASTMGRLMLSYLYCYFTFYFLRVISFLAIFTIPKTKSVSGSQSKRHTDRIEKITIRSLSKTTNEEITDKSAPMVATITACSIFSFLDIHLILLVGYVYPRLYISSCISSLSLSLGLQSRHHSPMSKLTSIGTEQKRTDEKDVTILLYLLLHRLLEEVDVQHTRHSA